MSIVQASILRWKPDNVLDVKRLLFVVWAPGVRGFPTWKDLVLDPKEKHCIEMRLLGIGERGTLSWDKSWGFGAKTL